jgi:hypothetical protein
MDQAPGLPYEKGTVRIGFLSVVSGLKSGSRPLPEKASLYQVNQAVDSPENLNSRGFR